MILDGLIKIWIWNIFFGGVWTIWANHVFNVALLIGIIQPRAPSLSPRSPSSAELKDKTMEVTSWTKKPREMVFLLSQITPVVRSCSKGSPDMVGDWTIHKYIHFICYKLFNMLAFGHVRKNMIQFSGHAAKRKFVYSWSVIYVVFSFLCMWMTCHRLMQTVLPSFTCHYLRTTCWGIDSVVETSANRDAWVKLHGDGWICYFTPRRLRLKLHAHVFAGPDQGMLRGCGSVPKFL